MFNIYREEIRSPRYSYIFAVIIHIFISRNFTADQIPYAIREIYKVIQSFPIQIPIRITDTTSILLYLIVETRHATSKTHNTRVPNIAHRKKKIPPTF